LGKGIVRSIWDRHNSMNEGMTATVATATPRPRRPKRPVGGTLEQRGYFQDGSPIVTRERPSSGSPIQ